MSDASTQQRLAYSPSELAPLLGCSRQHLQNLIARQELPSFKLGRKRLIPADVVDQLMAGAPALTDEQNDRLRQLLPVADR